ncbi:MAG TPA: TraR/DksA C4-type zinc finger protein [Acidimicrobiales bacterium]|nr:TraR/DksA C4-type zinc finger protein [Acidimicrobiales bacterium]
MLDDYVTALAEADRLLDEVDDALVRLEDGRYGTCDACGQPIDDERLAAFPLARTCGNHPQLTDSAAGGGHSF